MKSPFIHLIVWLLVCGATLAGYGLWYAAVANKSAAVANLQNQINTKTQTSVRVAAARLALAEISGDESIVQNYFVPETGVVPFIDHLETLASAQKTDMKVLSVATGGTAKQSNLVLMLTISIDGSFDAVMRTIGAIEYAPYDLIVSKLALTSGGKDAWHADLQAVIGSVPATQASSTPPAPLATSSKSTP